MTTAVPDVTQSVTSKATLDVGSREEEEEEEEEGNWPCLSAGRAASEPVIWRGRRGGERRGDNEVACGEGERTEGKIIDRGYFIEKDHPREKCFRIRGGKISLPMVHSSAQKGKERGSVTTLVQ